MFYMLFYGSCILLLNFDCSPTSQILFYFCATRNTNFVKENAKITLLSNWGKLTNNFQYAYIYLISFYIFNNQIVIINNDLKTYSTH